MADAPFSPLVRIFFSRIFPWAFILAGAALICANALALFRAQASTQWPMAEGKVIHSEIDRQHGGEGTRYEAEVQYDYVVKGTTYSSNRVFFGSTSREDPSEARLMVNRYPKGIAVTIRHSPNDPALSVLEPGIHGTALILPAFGMVFFLAGCALAKFLPRLFRLADGMAPATPDPAS